MNLKKYHVYILASNRNGTLYVGFTSNLLKRVWLHKHNLVKGFTQRYAIHRLVYIEVYKDVNQAIAREKYLKGKTRKYKLDLVEKSNHMWDDLYENLI
jgi:putative endonuclease